MEEESVFSDKTLAAKLEEIDSILNEEI